MKILTKEVLKTFPALGVTSKETDPMVWAKFFYPDFDWTWYVIEYDPKDEIFFGYVEGWANELGSFSLKELEENTGKFGCKIERDLYFKPCGLSEIKNK